jgi:hypothetical protein
MILIGDWAIGNNQVRLNSYDTIVLGNLEGPVLPHNHFLSKSPKTGPSLLSCELPSQNNRFIFSLANNHIMDYGLTGLEITVELLDKNGFKSCGAGNNIHDARRPIIVEDKGVQVGVIACCEAQFGVARRNSPGVAEFGSWIYRAIRDLRETVDAVIVSVHAAVEDSPWPSPYIRELYQSFIDAGATVVHGHHAHVPQGYEAYGNGVIFYGMGNFAVDPEKWRNYSNGMWSLAAEIDFQSSPLCWRPFTLEIRQEPDSDTVVIKESNNEERESHRRYLEICNRPFDNQNLFESLWHEVALRVYYHHGARHMGFSVPLENVRCSHIRTCLSMLKRALLNRVAPPSPSQGDYLSWYHMIACESHRQMLATALGVLGGEIVDLRGAETRRLADEMMPWSKREIQT